MHSKLERLMYFSTIPRLHRRTLARGAPWLPPELINNILAFLADEGTSGADLNRFLSGLARMCRCWYHPVMDYLYGTAAPTSLRSCELLIRSLDSDPQLSFLIRSLTIPKDVHLFTFNMFKVRDSTLVQNLVGKCPHLVELRIPMSSSFMWTKELLQAKLPSMQQLSKLRSLEISAFDTIDPSDPKDIAAEYVTMWLNQVSSLPQLEHLALSGVAFSARFSPWPSLPNLRSLSLHRPWWSSGENISLLSHVGGSLKVLRVTGLFESPPWSWGSYDFDYRLKFTLISIPIVASTLEDLTIMSQDATTYYHRWLSEGLVYITTLLPNMSSLRRLHLSSRFYHPDLLLNNPPPLLGTLVITMHGDRGSELNIRELLRLLSGTSIKNLVIKLKGYLWEINYIYVAVARPVLYPDSVERAIGFEREMHQLAQELGINFRLEKQYDSSLCLPKRSKWKGTKKFFERLKISI